MTVTEEWILLSYNGHIYIALDIWIGDECVAYVYSSNAFARVIISTFCNFLLVFLPPISVTVGKLSLAQLVRFFAVSLSI